MSHTNPDSPVTADTSLPEVPLMTNTYPPPTPREDIENQLLKLPEDWKLPSRLLFRIFFHIICVLLLGQSQSNLELLWQQVRRENGWEKYFAASCDVVVQITAAVSLLPVLMHLRKD
jgi:hypothetical protein